MHRAGAALRRCRQSERRSGGTLAVMRRVGIRPAGVMHGGTNRATGVRERKREDDGGAQHARSHTLGK